MAFAWPAVAVAGLGGSRFGLGLVVVAVLAQCLPVVGVVGSAASFDVEDVVGLDDAVSGRPLVAACLALVAVSAEDGDAPSPVFGGGGSGAPSVSPRHRASPLCLACVVFVECFVELLADAVYLVEVAVVLGASEVACESGEPITVLGDGHRVTLMPRCARRVRMMRMLGLSSIGVS